MELAVVLVFFVGYVLIALEHPIQINKTATALVLGAICWAIYALNAPAPEVSPAQIVIPKIPDHSDLVKASLSHHLGNIASILFFLMGAMTIVELIDSHHGFKPITDFIKTKNIKVLLWMVCSITFFLSAILDNLTTAIVMVSLIRKLIHEKRLRLFFAGMIVIAANAGGAWSPIGDVTTTMLWIGGQISADGIVKSLFLPSVVCLLVPLLCLTFILKGNLVSDEFQKTENLPENSTWGKIMLGVGISALVFVPIFKAITHLPPYMGILLGLGVLWVVSELINPNLDEADRKRYSAAGALSRIDISSVLFFFGILLAVSALESMGILQYFAEGLTKALGDNRLIISLIGVFSAIVDNVPLVAAAMGMYTINMYPTDSMIWEYLAYCAGTGGSLLIIGSAAGVAVMGMEKIDFFWYFKNISLLALIGYVSGAIAYLLQ
ncbi:MAG: sodium:proton antiporter NhaD [Cytophagales bacterium]